jgi:glycosyltransferase involved in cell wall biosynthesis
MEVVHLTSSTFLGGPERQMLGLAREMAQTCRSVFLSFAEGGRCQSFLEEARRRGFTARSLEHDTPHLLAAIRELTDWLEQLRADVLCCHGYKANLLGRIAARQARVPVVAVSRGWTGESLKIRLYEALDRLNLHWMDRVVCVSEGQARKVRRVGVPDEKIQVIRNAVRTERFDGDGSSARDALSAYFPSPPGLIVGAAGRLSPEKGFDVLIEAARLLTRKHPSIGYLLFGAGSRESALARQIETSGLQDHFRLAGFHANLDDLLPGLDLLVLPSYTEGLPNVILEALAAAVPVVATAVGGTPEVVEEGVNGYLVAPGNPEQLAQRIQDMIDSEPRRREMGRNGRQRMSEEFTFSVQARAYERLFAELQLARRCAPARERVARPALTGSGWPETLATS